MKKYQSISHLTGREQQALLRLKKIVQLYKPLIIYFIGCRSSTHLVRNYLAHPRNENHWHFYCDLLLIMPDESSLPENAVEELKSLSKEYDNIRIFTHPFHYVAQQIKEYSLFFCWMQRRAVILFERDNAIDKLPEPLHNMKRYEKQVYQFFLNNRDYKHYADVKLSPLPIKSTTRKNPAEETEYKLSAALQYRMARFLHEYGAKAANVCIREVLLEYVVAITEVGIPNKFKDTIWNFEELMRFFDMAGKELIPSK